MQRLHGLLFLALFKTIFEFKIGFKTSRSIDFCLSRKYNLFKNAVFEISKWRRSRDCKEIYFDWTILLNGFRSYSRYPRCVAWIWSSEKFILNSGLLSIVEKTGCGSFGRAVASNTIILQFESSHWLKFCIEHIYC